MLIISDASPIIALYDAGYLELLRMSFGGIIIPEEVFAEVFQRGRQRAKPAWIKVQALTDPQGLATFSVLRNSLDKGESAAISLAITCNACVLIDEELGTAECRKRKVACVTTAQIVENLIKDGKIKGKQSRAIVLTLRMHGVYVEDPGAA